MTLVYTPIHNLLHNNNYNKITIHDTRFYTKTKTQTKAEQLMKSADEKTIYNLIYPAPSLFENINNNIFKISNRVFSQHMMCFTKCLMSAFVTGMLSIKGISFKKVIDYLHREYNFNPLIVTKKIKSLDTRVSVIENIGFAEFVDQYITSKVDWLPKYYYRSHELYIMEYKKYTGIKMKIINNKFIVSKEDQDKYNMTNAILGKRFLFTSFMVS